MAGHSSNKPSPPEVGRLLVVAYFDVERFSDVRRAVDAAARDCGLDSEKALDFVAAVNEVMTNAIRHGGGRGELRLWETDQLMCEVRDQGAGFPATDYLNRTEPPTPSPAGGMGLWIAQRTSDGMTVDSGPAGTTVRISAQLRASAG
ncbi:ATP-binding protein [Plantactinospora sp. B24E8]|uniref:ATP-binding protein n=1 Tax=Plantactinospora sp. B24E8 TaxID=3153567 RepID=UPI00325EABBA